jgi:hypothetical protein
MDEPTFRRHLSGVQAVLSGEPLEFVLGSRPIYVTPLARDKVGSDQWRPFVSIDPSQMHLDKSAIRSGCRSVLFSVM